MRITESERIVNHSYYIHDIGQCEVTCVSSSVAPGIGYTFTFKVTQAPGVWYDEENPCPKVGDVFTRTMVYNPKRQFLSAEWEYAASYEWAYRFLDRHKHGCDGPCTSFVLLSRVMRDVANGDVHPTHAADYIHETFGHTDDVLVESREAC